MFWRYLRIYFSYSSIMFWIGSELAYFFYRHIHAMKSHFLHLFFMCTKEVKESCQFMPVFHRRMQELENNNNKNIIMQFTSILSTFALWFSGSRWISSVNWIHSATLSEDINSNTTWTQYCRSRMNYLSYIHTI